MLTRFSIKRFAVYAISLSMVFGGIYRYVHKTESHAKAVHYNKHAQATLPPARQPSEPVGAAPVVAKKPPPSGPVYNVCLTSDKNTVGGMIAAINSIRLHSKSHVKFYLVTTPDTVRHLKTWIDHTRLHNIDYELKAFNVSWVKGKIRVRTGRPELASPMNYARYYIPQLFPNLKGRMVFIDDDCIVQGDIAELANTTIKKGHWAAFSEECSSVSKRFAPNQHSYKDFVNFNQGIIKKFHMDPLACAFNTGVYVADVDLWHRNNVTAALAHWMHLNTKSNIYGNERGGGGSQPPMMLVFYKRHSLISPLWHVRYLGLTPGTRYSSSFLDKAKLIHWNGRFKPWNGLASHTHIWDEYFVPDPTSKFRPVRKQFSKYKKINS